ncbi:DUF192 domain-containing protein [Asaia sp. VD9]|uniref:DUF192 domain-containing protein n=1 Tax=Asaia sp. VD9 TaxID=3081235 RepID=UPI00301746CD
MNTILRSSLLLASLGIGMPAFPISAAETRPVAAQAALEKASLSITDRQGNKHDFTVEIARTQKEKEAGEMARTSVPDGTGMLFLFNPPEAAAMWMHDTPVSLDIVFIGADGRIQAIAERAVPFSERRLTGQGESVAVLETAAGAMEKAGIVVGDLVTSKALVTAH